jgi:hypothetical protein
LETTDVSLAPGTPLTVEMGPAGGFLLHLPGE